MARSWVAFLVAVLAFPGTLRAEDRAAPEADAPVVSVPTVPLGSGCPTSSCCKRCTTGRWRQLLGYFTYRPACRNCCHCLGCEPGTPPLYTYFLGPCPERPGYTCPACCDNGCTAGCRTGCGLCGLNFSWMRSPFCRSCPTCQAGH